MKTLCKVESVLEWVIFCMSAAGLVFEVLHPGSLTSWPWIITAAAASFRCVINVDTIRLLDSSAEYWREQCRERDNDVAMLCRENAKLAERLREFDGDMDDLK